MAELAAIICGMEESDFDRARRLFVEGLTLLQQDDAAAAEQRFVASLDSFPGRPSTLVNLGVARLRQGRAQEALQALDAAVAAEPAAPDAWGHRGQALAMLGRHEEALNCYDALVERVPTQTGALYQRAVTLNLLRRHDEALATLKTLIDLQPLGARAWLELARTRQCLGRHDEALPAYRRAVVLDPHLAEAWSLLGQFLKDAGQTGEAATCLERALAAGAEPELHRWMLAGVRGSTTAEGTATAQPPAHAPASYVEHLFDGYAADFDHHLVAALQYRGPQEIARLLDAVPAPRVAAGLDLGCGTGLAAPVLRAHADAVDGVDLAGAMLERARAGGAYRALHRADLAAYLAATPDRYGLVAAADVFIYVGALDAVFAGVRRVLLPGGRFVFSVEDAAPQVDFELRTSLRYAHGLHALQQTAQDHGLVWLADHVAPLRLDRGQPISGRYVLLGAPGS